MAFLNKKIPVVIQPKKNTTAAAAAKTQMSELSLQKTRWLIYLYSTIVFGVGTIFFITGIVYLTIYYYPYSLTAFSTTLCAAL